MIVVIKFSTNELQNDLELLSVLQNRIIAFYVDLMKMVIGVQIGLHKC